MREKKSENCWNIPMIFLLINCRNIPTISLTLFSLLDYILFFQFNDFYKILGRFLQVKLYCVPQQIFDWSNATCNLNCIKQRSFTGVMQ